VGNPEECRVGGDHEIAACHEVLAFALDQQATHSGRVLDLDEATAHARGHSRMKCVSFVRPREYQCGERPIDLEGKILRHQGSPI
jgi:hypothetical protein